VPTDSDSGLETFWNATVSIVLNAFDAYGWIVPATILAVLFLAMIGLVCWWMEELPFELPVFDGVRGIFKWMRSSWQTERSSYSLFK
jgi:hypothetical protein